MTVLPNMCARLQVFVSGVYSVSSAAQPIHWIYTSKVMAEALAGREATPEFVSPSRNPYYCIPTGSQSPYGDLLVSMLDSLVECGGFNAEACADKMQTVFGPGTAYDDPTSASYVRHTVSTRVQGKWLGFVLRRFTECHAEGKKVEELTEEDCAVDPENIIRLVPLVSLLAGRPELLATAEEAALQLQTSDLCLAVVLTAVRLLEQFIQGAAEPVKAVVSALKRGGAPLDRAMAGHLQAVLDSTEKSVATATLEFGMA